MEKVEEDKFEANIQEALKSNESLEQCMFEAVPVWDFLGITEEEYMNSLVSIVDDPVEIKEEEKVDGGDISKSDISKLDSQVET